MIDLTRDSESESDAESSSGNPRSGSGPVLTSACPTRPLPSSNQRPPRIYKPSTTHGHEWEQVEISESPSAPQVRPPASVQNSRRSDGDNEADDSVDGQCEQSQQEQHEEGQEWEEGKSGGGGRGGFPPSREPDAPNPASTTQLLESGTVTEHQSPQAMQDAYLRIQSASRVVSLAREVMRSHSESHVSVQDITFLHIEGQRETARGPEYLCVGKMWFKADVGVLSDLLQTYRREIAGSARLATLRNRKRTGEEVEAVQNDTTQDGQVRLSSRGRFTGFLKRGRC